MKKSPGKFLNLSSDQYFLSLKSKSIFFDSFPGNSFLKQPGIVFLLFNLFQCFPDRIR